MVSAFYGTKLGLRDLCTSRDALVIERTCPITRVFVSHVLTPPKGPSCFLPLKGQQDRKFSTAEGKERGKSNRRHLQRDAPFPGVVRQPLSCIFHRAPVAPQFSNHSRSFSCFAGEKKKGRDCRLFLNSTECFKF